MVLPLGRIGAADLGQTGGKAANLGELVAAGLPVPGGFCVTAAAFDRFLTAVGETEALWAAVDGVAADDVEAARSVSSEVRTRLEAAPIPAAIEAAIVAAWETEGAERAYAVRSSATAEDLPTASFAGQQESYLNLRGAEALLEHVRLCWASLFTDRAILYRARNGFRHRAVKLAVVVQRMVLPEISGILFTADPITGDRRICAIDAAWGLGEALVSGLVAADLYRVDKRDSSPVEVKVADKRLAIRPAPEGGTYREALADARRTARVLSDEQVRELTATGRRIEAHFGTPQDVEWAIADDRLWVLQSRPITSLFPIPEPAPTDSGLHVYVSFNHVQVMTDALTPMARSLWRTAMPFGRRSSSLAPNPYLKSAAGRLYFDVTPLLRHRRARRLLPAGLRMADPLIAAGLTRLLGRRELAPGAATADRARTRNLLRWMVPVMVHAQRRLWLLSPERSLASVTAEIEAYVRRLEEAVAGATSPAARLRAARRHWGSVMSGPLMKIQGYLVAGMAADAIVVRLTRRGADPRDVERLRSGLVGNVATEMDLEVGDLADAARRSPEIAAALRQGASPAALEAIREAEPAAAFRERWQRFMARYGMRGPGEIDIGRPRWREDPSSLWQAVAASLKQTEEGAHRRRQRRLHAEGEAAGQRLIAVARRGPRGPIRAALVRRCVRVARRMLPLRDHPKYLLMRLFEVLRKELLAIATELVREGRLDAPDDVWFLELDELIGALEAPGEELRHRIAGRRAELERFARLTPPRLITSDGEVPEVGYGDRDLPDGALGGTPVSAGVVEGPARVISDPTRELLEPGEILVAPFTDPGWTPLFLNAAGLVMEVGGLMTHGSVVAREYGIPAVVGVLDATRLIETGQRLRVHGDEGWVQVLVDDVGGGAA